MKLLPQFYHIDDTNTKSTLTLFVNSISCRRIRLFCIFNKKILRLSIMSSKEGELKAGHPPAGTSVDFSIT